jgi:CDGSH-type Zn-finger protein
MEKIKIHKGRKYSICSCGLSKQLPFCDNEHREYNALNGTDYKSIKLITEETTIINLKSSKWTKK